MKLKFRLIVISVSAILFLLTIPLVNRLAETSNNGEMEEDEEEEKYDQDAHCFVGYKKCQIKWKT